MRTCMFARYLASAFAPMVTWDGADTHQTRCQMATHTLFIKSINPGRPFCSGWTVLEGPKLSELLRRGPKCQSSAQRSNATRDTVCVNMSHDPAAATISRPGADPRWGALINILHLLRGAGFCAGEARDGGAPGACFPARFACFVHVIVLRICMSLLQGWGEVSGGRGVSGKLTLDL